MYRQSAFGRVPPKRQEDISLPENYSGSAFRDYGDLPEEKKEDTVPHETVSEQIECENGEERKKNAEQLSLFSGITEKLSGDSLLLLIVLFIILSGGGDRDDGTLLAVLILLML